MSYERKWKLLADLLRKLQEEGEKIPADVLNDLRSAKTMIQVINVDPAQVESISRIDSYLRTVESYAIFTMEKLGKEHVEEWLTKLQKLEIDETDNKRETISRFVTRVPRNKNWIRIQISEDIPREEVKKLVDDNKLSYRIERTGHILVYGDRENIEALVKRLTEQFSGARKE